MPAYFIAAVEVHDPERYDRYRRHVMPSVEKHGGKFVVLTRRIEVAEGAWNPTRMVVLEFADMATAKRWYDSPEYQAVAADRHASTTTNAVFVEGVPAAPA